MFAAVLEHLRTSNVWTELHAALHPISSSQRAANGCHPTMITAVYPPGAAVQRLSGSHLQTKCFTADISSPLLHVRFLSAYSSVALLCSITDSLLCPPPPPRPLAPPTLCAGHCGTTGKTGASDCRGKGLVSGQSLELSPSGQCALWTATYTCRNSRSRARGGRGAADQLRLLSRSTFRRPE